MPTPTTTNIEVNGYGFELNRAGSGEPLILVHGSASDHTTWQKQMQPFAEHFDVIAYSRRFHWPNAPMADGDDYSMLQHAEDLQHVVRSLCKGPAHIVGHSYGAFLALMLAIRAPELVRSLTLAEPPVITLLLDMPPKPVGTLKLLMTRPRTALVILKFGARGMGPARAAAGRGDMVTALRSFGTAVLGREWYENLSEARLEQIRRNSFRAEFLGSGLAKLNEADVRAVTAPTLLIDGAHSPALFPHLNDRLAELLPNSERFEVRNASHMMQEDNPSAFNDAVIRFVARHSRS